MDGNATPQPSIHRRRRWWYVTWVLLLLGALGLFAWWETPAARGQGHVALMVNTPMPPGTRADWWIGPRRQWDGNRPFQGTVSIQGAQAAPLSFPLIPVQVALRRLHLGYIPRGTTDLLVVRIQAPSHPARYLGVDLELDLNRGYLGPHRRLFLRVPVLLDNLSTDPSHPSVVLL